VRRELLVYALPEHKPLVATGHRSYGQEIGRYVGTTGPGRAGGEYKMQSFVRWILFSLLLALAPAGCGPLTAVPTRLMPPTASRALEPAETPTPVPTATPVASTPTAVDSAQVAVLTWQREGGIAGFCDSVTVFADGEVRVTSCREQAVEIRRLSGADADRVRAWVDRLAPFEHVQSDDAVADSMTVRLTFAGQGTQAATEADLRAMLDFAAALTRPMGPGSSAGNATE